MQNAAITGDRAHPFAEDGGLKEELGLGSRLRLSKKINYDK